MVLVRVIRIARGRIAQRRFALDVDVVFVVVHLERRLRGFHDAPHDDRGDVDRVALAVVDLQLAALEVPHPQRQLPLLVKRICVAQAADLCRADIVAEQLQHLRLVRRHHEEPLQQEHPEGEQADRRQHPADRRCPGSGSGRLRRTARRCRPARRPRESESESLAIHGATVHEPSCPPADVEVISLRHHIRQESCWMVSRMGVTAGAGMCSNLGVPGLLRQGFLISDECLAVRRGDGHRRQARTPEVLGGGIHARVQRSDGDR